MKSPWRFFIVIEALLAIFLLWQLSSNPAMLIMLLFGTLNIYWALRKHRRRKFQLILGSVILIICLVNSPATWLMLIFAVIFLGLKGFEILVPYGIGILFEHATLYGKVDFDEDTQVLRNETIKMYSEDYDESPRRLKIVTNTLVGDVEVIRV